MNRFLVVVLLAGAGCKGGGHDCASAAANAMKVSEAGLANIPGLRSRLGALQATLAARCVADRWAREVIGCVGGATSEAALQACQASLGPDQQAALRRAMMEVMGMGGGGGAGGGPPASAAPGARP